MSFHFTIQGSKKHVMSPPCCVTLSSSLRRFGDSVWVRWSVIYSPAMSSLPCGCRAAAALARVGEATTPASTSWAASSAPDAAVPVPVLVVSSARADQRQINKDKGRCGAHVHGFVFIINI